MGMELELGQNGMTYFARIPEDQSDDESSGTTNVISGFFGKIFKTSKESSSSGDLQEQVRSHEDSSSGTSSKNEETSEVPKSSERTESNCSNQESGLSSRFMSIFNPHRSKLADYNQSDFRRFWMPDSSGEECYECQEKFTTFRRKHHCRLCGQIFCSKCCNFQVSGTVLGYSGDLRLCGYCAKVIFTRFPYTAGAKITRELEKDEKKPIKESGCISIATVSTGSVLWSFENLKNRTADQVSKADEAEEVLALDAPSTLSVDELALSQDRLMSSNSVSVISEQYSSIDDCEPDWVKGIEMSAADNRPASFISKTDDIGASLAASGSRQIVNEGSTESIVKIELNQMLKPKFDLGEDSQIETTVENLFEIRAEKMFSYLFDREMLDSSTWWNVLWPVCHQVSATVKVDIANRRDHLNILNHVHIKKLQVEGSKPSASVVNGVVCTKSLMRCEMQHEIHNASVLILEGSLEYERVPDKLCSIDPIIKQENEYLRKQVEKILSQRPTVILVEENVAHLAVEMLYNAGVMLVSNIKRSVLRRIARSLGCEVTPSLDHVYQHKLGFCPLVRQNKIYLRGGGFKNLLVFSECASDLGCSIILRANSMYELKAAKRILRYAILMLYSNRLELSLLSIFDAKVVQCHSDCMVCRLNCNEEDSDQESFHQRLKQSTLSTSPLINFGVPFLETAKGRECVLRPFFKNHLYRFPDKEDLLSKRDAIKKLEEEMIMDEDSPELNSTQEQHSFVTANMIDYDEDGISEFRATSGLILQKRLRKRKVKASRYSRDSGKVSSHVGGDVFDPYIHQRIAILFGSFSPKSSNAPFFCVRPWVLQMEMYGTNDMSLGDFLKRFCFNKDYQCPSVNCDIPMFDHARKMVFRNVCIEITIQTCVQLAVSESSSFPQFPNSHDTEITSWHYCTSCKSASSIEILTESVCRLSFARFLDYLANGSSVICNVATSNESCNHCCFHQHDKYFANGTYVVCFKVKPIRPYHVKFSPVVCRIQPLIFTRAFVVESKKKIEKAAKSIFDCISSQLEKTSFIDVSGNSHRSNFMLKLQEAKLNYDSVLSKFDPTNTLKNGELTIRSNDAIYIQAADTIQRCQYLIQHLIMEWNEQCNQIMTAVKNQKKLLSSATLPHTAANNTLSENTDELQKSSKPGEDCPSGNAKINEIELSTIDSPFHLHLHYNLPLPMQGLSYIVVKDFIDKKGISYPDIGSIIAYAMSSTDYEKKRRKLREEFSAEDIPLSLTASSNYSSHGSSEHIELDFKDDRAQFYVNIFFAERFYMLRKLLFVEGENCFINSLSASKTWKPQGGKSGAEFYRTEDNRFVFKQMSRFEIQSFVKFAHNYFNYISTAVMENKLTTLCKVYGVFRICYKNSQGSQLKVDVLVMEYLFYNRNVKQVWDLKGSQRNRMASEGKKEADLVLLDENLSKDLWNNQLYVHPHSKAALNMAISNDSHFLSAQHIMDYSLLVGVDEANQELILGIVDYMRTYTLDKRLESWVKIAAIPGAHLPTVISPEMYCTRFSDAIDTYFPVAPDQWTGLGIAFSY